MIPAGRCLVVAAHPDDETVGAAVWLRRRGLGDLMMVHLTDGSPRDPSDARAAGFDSRQAYAGARRRELDGAMDLLGVPKAQRVRLGLMDQDVVLCLRPLIEALRAMVREYRPEVVLSPAYEGGHPDHDAAAYALSRVPGAFRHLEYRLYHADEEGAMDTSGFLEADGRAGEVIVLTRQEREFKQQMLNCFASQARVLGQFRVVDEKFRDAPRYDFTKPPHSGTLLYERWGFPVSGAQWREKAAACH